MITLRPGSERGHARHGWLDSKHSFSFAEYQDPRHISFGALRVLNDDHVAPGAGFGAHPHRDMEIITYVLEGALAHKDSMGNGSIIRRGDVQRMSAGTGVVHSEFNASQSEPVKFLQIWIFPERQGMAPGYEQAHVSDAAKRGALVPIAGATSSATQVRIHQDATIHAGLFDGAESETRKLDPARRYYLHLVRGELQANGYILSGGDALLISDTTSLQLGDGRDAEVLLFDLK